MFFFNNYMLCVCFAGDRALCGHERAARSLSQLHPSSCAGAGAGVSLHLWQVKTRNVFVPTEVPGPVQGDTQSAE